MEYSFADPVYFYTRSMPFFELSNFCPPGLEENGVYWPTVEHYFQAQKFLDAAFRERIRQAASPKDAREFGRSRAFPIRHDWDNAREMVMLFALRQKFSKGHVLQVLLSTGERQLIEASPMDYFWGAGRDGTGLNRLGLLLEQVRAEARGERDRSLR